MKVLVIDNYDSFTYNLVQYLGEAGADVRTVRNDRATVDELLEEGYARCVISPGPCTPNEAGISLEAARRMPESGVPTLGVCLGHQAIAQAFGGQVKLHPPVHGKATTIEHDGRTIFTGLACPLTVGRYHSLVVDPALPDELEESARGGGVLMGLRHRELPVEGVQFHPESVLTEQGRELLANFLDGRVAGSESLLGLESRAGSPTEARAGSPTEARAGSPTEARAGSPTAVAESPTVRDPAGDDPAVKGRAAGSPAVDGRVAGSPVVTEAD